MGISLEQLAAFISAERNKFEACIKKEAEKLTLAELLLALKNDTELVKKIAYAINVPFEYGMGIKFDKYPFDIQLSPEELKIYYNHVLIKERKGGAVKRIYAPFAEKLAKEVTEQLDNLPF